MSRRKQKKHNKSYEPFQSTHLTLQQANQLKPNDKIDHRDYAGRFVHSKIIEKTGTKLKIHYIGWGAKWDVWSDYSKELHFFAKPKSISSRPANRFTELNIGDYIDFNPLKHPGWKYGEIASTDKKSAQVEIVYEINEKQHYQWAHLDDENEIAQFLTKSNPLNATQIAAEKAVNNSNKRKLKPEEFTFDDNTSPSLSQTQTQTQPRKKRKLNVNASDSTDMNSNPWADIMKSNEKYIPQWVKCNACTKWRFLLVLTANISTWKSPANFQCNNCSVAQQTDSEMSAMFSDVQLKALTVQRNSIMKATKTKQTSNGSKVKVISGSKKEGGNLEIIQLKKEKLELGNKNKLLVKEKRNLKREREEFKRLNKELLDKNSRLEEGNERLKLEVGKLKDAKWFEIKLGKVSSMDLEELDELEMEFKNGISVIKDARDRLLEGKLYCIVCLKNAKNVFVNGCGHLDMCSECERDMISKICPRCQIPYKSVTKINI